MKMARGSRKHESTKRNKSISCSRGFVIPRPPPSALRWLSPLIPRLSSLFRSIAPWRFLPCPACCKVCEACQNKQYPAELTLTLAGIQNDPLCNDCTGANGSWVVTKAGDCVMTMLFGIVQSAVTYHGSYNVPMCVCNMGSATLDLSLSIYWNFGGVAGTRVITAVLGNSLGCVSVLFQLQEGNQSEPFDCTQPSDVSLPYVDCTGFCSSPGATCSVSA